MRTLILALAVATPAPIQTPPKALEGSPDFISPVGEPYRFEDKVAGAEHWFATTDRDGDGRIVWAEFQANADAFFKRLDVDHNGEIEPIEIDRYETEIAPEIRVMSTGFDPAPSGDGGESHAEPYPDRLGAGRLSWIDLPEPIVAMDTNFDRGISVAEFQAAARKRFNALDANHDGALTRDELPKISPPHNGRGRRERGGRGGPGDHRGGAGGMGGGMGEPPRD